MSDTVPASSFENVLKGESSDTLRSERRVSVEILERLLNNGMETHEHDSMARDEEYTT